MIKKDGAYYKKVYHGYIAALKAVRVNGMPMEVIESIEKLAYEARVKRIEMDVKTP